MISNTRFDMRTFYYPVGNTSAVCLTQDLPPNQDADILLLGCGDARNILFTCCVDITRKMDITCCDIEPLIHARNILLYSLMIEDEANLNIECIWNIYFHWKVDKESLKLLETQIQKLLCVSNSMDEWHASVYGTSIQFCDEKSLSRIRSQWMGFRSQGLSHTDRKHRQNQMQGLIDFVKTIKRDLCGTDPIILHGCMAAAPVGYDAVQDVSEVYHHWWTYGTVPSSNASIKPTDLNPVILYSPNPAHMLETQLDPLVGFPLSIAFGSTFCLRRKHESSTQYLVNCAKNLFADWASALRKAVTNRLVIRIFCGDALDFCITLRNRQLTCGNQCSVKNAAPLTFDIIDTSNLVDHLGMLNVIAAASSVLKHHASSSLYTELFTLCDSNCIERLFDIFGVSAHSMSLLLGLVSPNLFTNATNSFENDPVVNGIGAWSGRKRPIKGQDHYRSRLRWKRSPGYKELNMHMEAKELSNLLLQVHKQMFRHEDIASMFTPQDPSKVAQKACKVLLPYYNRGSFAFLLSCLRTTVITDWDQCVKHIYNGIYSISPSGCVTPEYTQELLISMHLYGIDMRRFRKLEPADLNGAILAPRLPAIKELPVLLCVTIRVTREQLKFFTQIKDIDQSLMSVLNCSIQGGDPGEMPWYNTYSCIQMAFGTWHEENKLLPYIKEDHSKLWGSTSDMFVSILVSTEMLLLSKRSIPCMNVGLIFTPSTYQMFIKDLGQDLCFARCQMTSKDVFITQYMPGKSSLPGIPPSNPRVTKPISVVNKVRLTLDGLKIDTLTRRLTLESQEAKDELADRSSKIEVKFQSPLSAVVLIGQSQKIKCEFLAPVSPAKFKVRIARTSLYIEIESRLLDPLEEDVSSFIFPTVITKTPCGATIPLSWVSTHIDLDVMPPIDLKDTQAISWLVNHASLMFSVRERQLKFKVTNHSLDSDTRTNLKTGLFSIFMLYTGLKGQQAEIFGLTTTDGDIKMLIFPSCLRLDLVNYTVVLDAAMISITNAMLSDNKAVQFLKELRNHGLCQVKVSEDENLAWRALMPALVERCRTATAWEHTANCEYVKAGEAPLSTKGASPICSCGIGKFPPGDYLKSLIERLPDLVDYMINRYGSRAAIAPIFAVPEVEDCSLPDFAEKLNQFMPMSVSVFKDTLTRIRRYFLNMGMYNEGKCVVKEKCAKCGKSKRENIESNEERLSRCSRCKRAKYCSRECQMSDWQKHKPHCSAA